MNPSPFPWKAGVVPTDLEDATGAIIADFAPPMFRRDGTREQNTMNCQLVVNAVKDHQERVEFSLRFCVKEAFDVNPTIGVWRPIETCPFERWVLLWFVTAPFEDGRKAPDATILGQRSLYEEGKFWNGHIMRPLAWVTHWMPLPEGPKP